jgi:ribosomal protein S18 acetylase RimI-like enzyme
MGDMRALRTEDREAAVDLWQRVQLTRPWNNPAQDFDRAIDNPTSAVLGELAGHTLVGTVMVGHDGHRGWVYYVAVDPDHRGGGVGRRMMAAAEDWLAERDVPKLNVMVRHTNREALGFYTRLGYRDSEVTVLSRWLEMRRDT